MEAKFTRSQSVFLVFCILVFCGFKEGEVVTTNNGTHYKLVKELGRGAFAHGWEVEEEETGIHAVLKLFKTPDSPDVRQQTETYKHLSSAFRKSAPSSHILLGTYLEVQQNGGQILPAIRSELGARVFGSKLQENEFLLRRYMPSHELKRRITNARYLWSELKKGIMELAGAGFSHHDISPANIIRVDTVFKLGDLGGATTIGAGPPEHGWDAQYGPPEYHLDDYSNTVSSDLAAAAASVFALVLGIEPYWAAFQRVKAVEPGLLESLPDDYYSLRYARFSPVRRFCKFKVLLATPRAANRLESFLRNEMIFSLGAERNETFYLGLDLMEELLRALQRNLEQRLRTLTPSECSTSLQKFSRLIHS